jgi:hypothetical protein
VTPSSRSANSAVGVEPTLTTGAGRPAARSASAAATAPARSCSAIARKASGERHHAAQLGPLRAIEAAADLHQARVARRDSGTAAVGVDLDQHREGRAQRGRPLRRKVRRLDAVEDDRHVRAAPPQVRDVRQLPRRNSDRVENVGEAVGEEMLRLPQRRDGDPARLRLDGKAHRVDRLGRLDVRPQRHAEAGKALAHSCDVAGEARPVEDQGRRFEVNDMHGGPIARRTRVATRFGAGWRPPAARVTLSSCRAGGKLS